MWYSRVVGDLSLLPDFVSYYENELDSAKKDCRIGGVVEKNITALPGITEHRFNQLQEIEAVLNFLNIQLRKIRRRHFQKYLEGYARALTSRDAEKYVDGEDEVDSFYMMMMAGEGVICAPSTFCWWAAWLGLQGRRVFLPSRFARSRSCWPSWDAARLVLSWQPQASRRPAARNCPRAHCLLSLSAVKKSPLSETPLPSG